MIVVVECLLLNQNNIHAMFCELYGSFIFFYASTFVHCINFFVTSMLHTDARDTRRDDFKNWQGEGDLINKRKNKDKGALKIKLQNTKVITEFTERKMKKQDPNYGGELSAPLANK